MKEVLICDKCDAENWNMASEGRCHDQAADEIKGHKACNGIWRRPPRLAADPRPKGKLLEFPKPDKG